MQHGYVTVMLTGLSHSSAVHTSFHDMGSQRNVWPASSGGSLFLYSCGLSSFSRNNRAAAYEADKQQNNSNYENSDSTCYKRIINTDAKVSRC